MKKTVLISAIILPLSLYSQKPPVPEKYAAGAVPVVDGAVVFTKDYTLKGRSNAQIMDSLLAYANRLILAENSLPQCRISAYDKEKGLLAVNMEETIYFKRKAWLTDCTRAYYQLLFQTRDGGFTATMRNIRFLYEEERNGGFRYDAEKWITDDVALVKNGAKLSRLSGKFRTKTIDRKDELFEGAYHAAGGRKLIRKWVYEEAEE